MAGYKSKIMPIIVGIVILAFIPVAMQMVTKVSGVSTVDNQIVENASGSILWENSENTSQTIYADNVSNSDWVAVTETVKVDHMSPWIEDLLLLITPLGMGASALYSFTRVIT